MKQIKVIIATAIALGIFIIDTLTPTGYADWQPYALFPAVVCTILIVLGSLLSPPEIKSSIDLTNRLLGVLALWIASSLIVKRKHTEIALRQAYEELEKRVEERTSKLAQVNASLQREITERTQAEEALEVSERNYRPYRKGRIFRNTAESIGP